MDSMHSFWQLGDELRGHSKTSEDHKWLMVASKLAEQTSMLNLESKFTENVGKSSLRNGVYNMNVVYPKNNASLVANISGNKYHNNLQNNKEFNNNGNNSNNNENGNTNAADKRFKTLPASETLLPK
ncbi:hypothetical protein K1719_034004 [Acacia pycnantha]|nr:hypothetical protein K1719_034004 [Acacia pycnantha]